jgi:peptidoglycan/LPS O-acetylase OafA/YrhL
MRTAVRFRWQSAAIALVVITLAFVVPGIALCKVVPLASIAYTIAITTLIAGLGLYWAARSTETRSPQCERVDYYLQASILVVTAALLWFQLILQPGLWQDRNIDPTAALAIVFACGIAGGVLLMKRGRRITGDDTN